jgi:hypothetical protein
MGASPIPNRHITYVAMPQYSRFLVQILKILHHKRGDGSHPGVSAFIQEMANLPDDGI